MLTSVTRDPFSVVWSCPVTSYSMWSFTSIYSVCLDFMVPRHKNMLHFYIFPFHQPKLSTYYRSRLSVFITCWKERAGCASLLKAYFLHSLYNPVEFICTVCTKKMKGVHNGEVIPVHMFMCLTAVKSVLRGQRVNIIVDRQIYLFVYTDRLQCLFYMNS
jgi:hypothetical protein